MKIRIIQGMFITILIPLILLSCGYSLSNIREMNDVTELRTAFKESEDIEIKYEVIRKLGEIQSSQAKKALLTYIDHSNKQIRSLAMDSLEDYPVDNDITEAMIEKLTDESNEVVNKAVDYLGDNVLDAERQIAQGLKDDDYRVRLGCLRALKYYPIDGTDYPSFIRDVVDLSKPSYETVDEVREQANKLLGDLKVTLARIVLFRNKFADESAKVRDAAQNALNQVLGRADFVYEDVILAIIPLSNMTKDAGMDQFCIDFTDHIMSILMREKVCKVIERAQINRIIDQLEISASDLYSDVNAPKIGELTQATQVMYGALQLFQNEYSITLKRTVIQTGEVVQVETLTGYKTNLNQMKNEIANKMLRSFAMSEIR